MSSISLFYIETFQVQKSYVKSNIVNYNLPITQLKKQHNKCTLIPLEHVLILSFLSPFFPVVTSILQLYFYSMYILLLSLHISYLSSIYSIGLYILKLSIESCYIKYISFHDLLFKIIINRLYPLLGFIFLEQF